MAEGKNLVGVDIGASSIKVVQLKEARKSFRSSASASRRCPPQSIVDGHVMNSRRRRREPRSRSSPSARSSRRTSRSASAGRRVIIRKITVPMMTHDELDEQIQWEAEQHIPFDIKVMSIDYEVLRRRPEAGQMDLLLVAAKKDEINDYAAIVREAKLKPLVVDIDAFTIQNIFEYQQACPRTDHRAHQRRRRLSSINIVSQGRQRLHARHRQRRQLRSPRRSRSSSTCRSSRPRPTSAAAARRTSSRRRCTRSSSRRATRLAGEIQRSLDFYLATSGETEIRRIFVSGGSAYLAPLCQSIEKRAHVPVQVFDPDGEPRRRREVRERSGHARSSSAARRRARSRLRLRQGAARP